MRPGIIANVLCRCHRRRPQSHTGAGAVSTFRRPTAHDTDGPGDAAPPEPPAALTRPMIRCATHGPMMAGRCPNRHHRCIRQPGDGRTGGLGQLRTGRGPRGDCSATVPTFEPAADATPGFVCGGRSPPGHEPSWAMSVPHLVAAEPTMADTFDHKARTSRRRLQPQDAQQSRPALLDHANPPVQSRAAVDGA